MRSFKDTAGREWRLEITVAEVEDVFDETGIDLGDPKSLERVYANNGATIKVLSVLIRGQLAERGLEDKAVKRSFDADVLAAARDALMEEIIFFTPSAQRPLAERLLAAVKRRFGLRQSQAGARVDAAVAEIEAGAMDKAMGFPDSAAAPPSSSGATASPASPALTPAP